MCAKSSHVLGCTRFPGLCKRSSSANSCFDLPTYIYPQFDWSLPFRAVYQHNGRGMSTSKKEGETLISIKLYSRVRAGKSNPYRESQEVTRILAKQIQIEFEKGGKFVATLLENEAPHSSEALWKHLPTEGTAAQARYGGEEFFFKADLQIEKENAKTKFSAGDVCFNPDPKWNAVIIYYGNNISVSTPYNHVAKISDGLDELHAIGERIWLKGAEKIHLRAL